MTFVPNPSLQRAPRNLPLFSEIVRRKRSCGTVTSAFIAREADVQDVEAADRLAAAQGFALLGPRWRRIDLAAARRIIERILERDLAYDTAVMPADDAASLAEQWLGLTSESRAFFTNGTWSEGPVQTAPRATAGPSWDPITDSTFDAGVVAVDQERAVMLWVQDED